MAYEILQAASPSQIVQARHILAEYAESLGLSDSFPGFKDELLSLPGDYAPPEGRLLLATYDGELAGCVALRKLEPSICEMRRLYLRPKFRGRGFGRTLANYVIEEARKIGYRQMRLGTVEPKMQDALRMYREIGFRVTMPYRTNPLKDAVYMELDLVG